MRRLMRDIIRWRRYFLIIAFFAQIKVEARVAFVTGTNDRPNAAIVTKTAVLVVIRENDP